MSKRSKGIIFADYPDAVNVEQMYSMLGGIGKKLPMLFSDYMLDWLGVIKNSVEEVTCAGYETCVKQRIVPCLS